MGTDEEVPVCCSGAPGEALTSLSQKVSYLLLGDSGHIHYFLELCENLGSSVLGYCHTLIGEEGQVGKEHRDEGKFRAPCSFSHSPLAFPGTGGTGDSWKHRLRISGWIRFVIWAKFSVFTSWIFFLPHFLASLLLGLQLHVC